MKLQPPDHQLDAHPTEPPRPATGHLSCRTMEMGKFFFREKKNRAIKKKGKFFLNVFLITPFVG